MCDSCSALEVHYKNGSKDWHPSIIRFNNLEKRACPKCNKENETKTTNSD